PATAPLFAQGEPSITRVAIEGNVRVEEDAIRVHLRTQTGQPFERDTLDRDIRAVYAMGFFDQVDADVSPAGENHVAVTFRVKERALVRTVMERLTAFYYDHGYITVKVDEPRVERRDDGLHVTVKIEEGDQYRVADVTIVGSNVPPDTTRLRRDLATTPGDVFKASALREDVQKLTERLSDDGYAFATVDPDTEMHPEQKTVDIAFQVDRGRQVTVERIEVTGNTKTRDQVLRREMRLQEQE